MPPATRSSSAVKRQQEIKVEETNTDIETETEEEDKSSGPSWKRRRDENDLENRTCVICNRVFTKAIHMRNHMLFMTQTGPNLHAPIVTVNTMR